MNLRNTTLSMGLLLALLAPAAAFAGDLPGVPGSPLVVAKDEAKCELCITKLTAGCDRENKTCVQNNGAAACQAYYEKCKASVKGRCGGPSLCD